MPLPINQKGKTMTEQTESKAVKISPNSNAMRVTIEVAIRHKDGSMKIDTITAETYVELKETTTNAHVMKKIKPAIIDAMKAAREHKTKGTIIQ